MLKVLFVVTALFATCYSPLSLADEPTDAADEPLHIYLLIGQSNMAGRATIPDEASGEIERCVLLNGEGGWVPARNPLNLYSTIRKGENMQKLGPGYGFVRRLLDQNQNLRIGLVVNAKGGTKIEQWAKGTKFFDEAVTRTKAAMTTGELKGILWHQGESNAGNPEGYAEKLAQLVSDLRTDLEADDVPFIAGQLLPNPKRDAVNAQIDKLPTLSPFTAVASSEQLTTSDNTHFDTAGQLELGRRYAEALIAMTGPAAERAEK